MSARMTVAEFLEWPEDPTGALWQLVDGELTMRAPASDVHNTLLGNLSRLIGNHLDQTRPECRVVPAAGIRPWVRRDYNVRIPESGGDLVECVDLLHDPHGAGDPGPTYRRAGGRTVAPDRRRGMARAVQPGGVDG